MAPPSSPRSPPGSSSTDRATAAARAGRLEEQLRRATAGDEVTLRTDGGWHRSSRCESLACVEVARDGDLFTYDLTVQSADGATCERWDGVRFRVVAASSVLINAFAAVANVNPAEKTSLLFRDFHQVAYEVYEDLGDSRRALGHLPARLPAFAWLVDRQRAGSLAPVTSAAAV